MIQPQSAPFVSVIEPPKGWRALNLREVWDYRHLIYFFAWRDIKVRYKQTIIGPFWAVIQPFVTMVVFSIFFGGLAQIPSDGIPYPVFSFTALVPWTFFSVSLASVSNSVLSSASMIKKIYFPRLIIPLAAVGVGLFDFFIAFGVLLGMILVFNAVSPLAPLVFATETLPFIPMMTTDPMIIGKLIWLPILLILTMMTAFGVGLWFATMNVQFRDMRYSVSLLVRFWLFATPVIYPASLVGEQFRLLYSLNPMVGVIEGFRWVLLGTNTAPTGFILISFVVATVVLVSGLFYFNRMEKYFSDVI